MPRRQVTVGAIIDESVRLSTACFCRAASGKIWTMSRKYHIWTEGCQMNVADSQRVASALEQL
ncbi:MAG: hypothetical protein RMK99_10750, partial [Anaerolineales bacterium]|nr:hypothetical protein [Anaerolineales bacterium]